MSIVETVMSIFAGRPRPDGLPPVSPETITRAEATAAGASQATAAVAALGPTAPARPVPTPALLAKPRVPTAPAVREAENPAVAALRLEVQQLRLMKTPDGNRAMAARLRESQAARRALAARLSGLQTANESLNLELRTANTKLREAEDALAVYELGPRP